MEIERKIEELQDTFLAKFKFGRFVIQVLVLISKILQVHASKAKSLQNRITELEIQIESQQTWNKEMLETLKELVEKVSAPTNTDPNFRTAAQILQERYAAYMKDRE